MEAPIQPLAELESHLARRLEHRASLRRGDFSNGDRSVSAPPADAEHLVEPVRNELVANPCRRMAAAVHSPLGALDASLGKRRVERRVDLLSLFFCHASSYG